MNRLTDQQINIKYFKNPFAHLTGSPGSLLHQQATARLQREMPPTFALHAAYIITHMGGNFCPAVIFE
jgi:hypothetical protein